MTGKYRIDYKLREQIKNIQHGLDVSQCFQCNLCTSSCDVARFSEKFKPARIVKLAILGIRDILEEEELWYCTTCFFCFDRCPQLADPTEIILTLRNISAREGNLPMSQRRIAKNILLTGHSVGIEKENVENRRNLELEDLPPTAAKHKDAIEDIQKILKKTGAHKIIRFNFDTMELED